MPEERLAAAEERLSIRAAVVESLKNLSERTRSQVVEHFAAAEATKQAAALVSGLDKLAGLEMEHRKIKPQNNAFNAAGDPIGDPSFTREQIEQRKKVDEQIEKLTKAINKADDKNDFGDLYNLVK